MKKLVSIALMSVLTLNLFSQNNDFDGDGYSSSGGSDCNDSNPFIYPGAYEICDGLDNNCDGVLDTQPTISIYFIPESMVIEPNETFVVCQTTGATFGDGTSEMVMLTHLYIQ